MRDNASTLEAPGDAPRGLVPVLVGWVLLSVTMMIVGIRSDGGFRYVDNDSVARLVQLRDLLGGQGWYDLTQYRLGPDGVVMHWSRLVDVPLAALTLGFRLFVDGAQAEWTMMTVWPVLTILPLFVAVWWAGLALEGRYTPVFGLILTGGLVLHSLKFVPGAIDHHNLQMALLATMMAAVLVRTCGPWPLVIAGLSGAASLAVGIEMAPPITVLSASVAALWVAGGAEAGPGTGRFFASLGGGLLVLFLLTAPPEHWSWPLCDALTMPLLAPVLLGSAAMALGSRVLTNSGRAARLAWLAGTAAATLASASAFPDGCLKSPLESLDPLVEKYWLAFVADSQSGLDVLRAGWDQYFGVFIVPLIAAAFAVQMARQPRHRADGLIYLALIATSYAATLYQIRGMYLMGLVSIPPLAWGIGGLYQRYRLSGSAGVGIAALALLALSLPPAWAVLPIVRASVAGPPQPRMPMVQAERDAPMALAAVPGDCTRAVHYRELAALAKGRVSAGTNLGPSILRETGHSVLAAPYHRDQAGMLAQLEIARSPVAGAGRALRQHGIDYIAICRADREYDWLHVSEPDSLFAALARGEVRGPVEMISSPDAMIRIFRVR